MNEQELVQEILDYIKTLYKAEYTGLLEIEKSDGFYSFKIGLPSYMAPTTIDYQTDSDDEFLAFIKEELRTRNYMRLYIYKVVRQEHDNREK